MGLPEILITFKTKGLTAIQRSERGIVAVILHDETEGGETLTVYNSITEVDFTKWSERNYQSHFCRCLSPDEYILCLTRRTHLPSPWWLVPESV